MLKRQNFKLIRFATRRAPLAAVTLALITTTLAACGASGSKAAASGPSSTSQSSSSTAAPAPTPTTTTTVSMVLSFPVGWEAPIFYGLQQGIFKQDGINLVISTPSGAEAGTDIGYISQGKFDVGYVGTYDLPRYQQKFNDHVVAIFAWAQQNPICWIVRDSANITSPAQLAGKTLAAPTGASKALIYKYFQHFGVPQSQVKLESVPGSALDSLFAANKVAAIASYSFEAGPDYSAQGIPVRSFCFSQAGQQYEASAIGANQSFMNSHKQAMAGLVKALVTSFTDAYKNPQAAAAALKAKFGKQVNTTSVDVAQMQAIYKLMRTSNDANEPLGWMSPTDMLNTVKYDQQNYGLSSSFNVNSYYTDQFFPKSS